MKTDFAHRMAFPGLLFPAARHLLVSARYFHTDLPPTFLIYPSPLSFFTHVRRYLDCLSPDLAPVFRMIYLSGAADMTRTRGVYCK